MYGGMGFFRMQNNSSAKQARDIQGGPATRADIERVLSQRSMVFF